MSLCPHGYTAFWDCPHCEEPMGTKPAVLNSDTGPQWIELRELAPGTRFMFAADDHPHRGPCTLVEKTIGRAMIRYDQPKGPTSRTFEARDEHGQKVTRTIAVARPELEPCALGAQVVPL